jgi:hypothetical protein
MDTDNRGNTDISTRQSGDGCAVTYSTDTVIRVIEKLLVFLRLN